MQRRTAVLLAAGWLVGILTATCAGLVDTHYTYSAAGRYVFIQSSSCEPLQVGDQFFVKCPRSRLEDILDGLRAGPPAPTAAPAKPIAKPIATTAPAPTVDLTAVASQRASATATAVQLRQVAEVVTVATGLAEVMEYQARASLPTERAFLEQSQDYVFRAEAVVDGNATDQARSLKAILPKAKDAINKGDRESLYKLAVELRRIK